MVRPTAQNAPVTDERIRVLVVHDDLELLDTLREYLENLGNHYVVEAAARGSEARAPVPTW